MYQRAICLFLVAKRLTPRVVHIELLVVFHEKPVGDSAITEYLSSLRFGERDEIQTDSKDTANADLANQTILQSSAFQPFA
jgi:hypothetical protein